LRLLGLEPSDALDIVAAATLSQIRKSERDNGGRPFWILELNIPNRESPTGVLYVKPALHLPSLTSGYLLSFKPSTDHHA
jgi:hypothetical protein